jgi:hypothetical protein
MKTAGYQHDKMECLFNKGHKVPKLRMMWHLAKCPDKKLYLEQGKPIFYCRFDANHIFLNLNHLQNHEQVCDKDPKRVQA